MVIVRFILVECTVPAQRRSDKARRRRRRWRRRRRRSRKQRRKRAERREWGPQVSSQRAAENGTGAGEPGRGGPPRPAGGFTPPDTHQLAPDTRKKCRRRLPGGGGPCAIAAAAAGTLPPLRPTPSLTGEDAAADGHIAGEGALVVDVGACAIRGRGSGGGGRARPSATPPKGELGFTQCVFLLSSQTPPALPPRDPHPRWPRGAS